MDRKHNSGLIFAARALRKRMTKEERHLWYEFLRDYPIRFRRQKVLGKYIVDFYCADAKLVVELDGSQHYAEQGQTADQARTAYLEGYGLAVVRISNNEVLQNFRGVCDYLHELVMQRTNGSPV